MRPYQTGLTACLIAGIFLSGPLLHAGELVLPGVVGSVPPGDSFAYPSPTFNGPMLKGIKVDPKVPFNLEFILDKGDSETARKAGLEGDLSVRGFQPPVDKEETKRLVKYFLAGLTVPDRDLWVNLSPYEGDRVVPEGLGSTDMGRDLLEQDYQLKRVAAMITYPERELGKRFWSRVYEAVSKRYGGANIPVNTFNKVWIMPDKALVYENMAAGTAYVVDSRLKVMLEQDYLAATMSRRSVLPHSVLDTIARDIVIPQLTKEVNEGKTFAQLRQIYSSMILAAWYKRKTRASVMNAVYAERNKVAGISRSPDAQGPREIYERYLAALRRGAYSYVKEVVDPATGQKEPRKYFSGGVRFGRMDQAMVITTTFRRVREAWQGLFRIKVTMAPAVEPVARPSVLDASLRTYLEIRERPYVPPDPQNLENAMRNMARLRGDFLPWVLDQMNGMQERKRPLRVRVIYMFHGGGGQAGKLALLIRGLLSLHRNVEICVEQLAGNVGPSYGFGLERLPNVRFGPYLGFSSFQPDVTVGINAGARKAAGRNLDFSINVLATNHGRAELNGAVNDDDLATPMGSIILDRGLLEMRRRANAAGNIKQRALERRRWLGAQNLGEQANSALKDSEWSIWTFAHSHKLVKEIALIRRALDHEDSLSRYFLRDGQHDAAAKRVVIFSGSALADPLELLSLGVTVVHNGMVLQPLPGVRLPVTVVIKDFNNTDVRELIAKHTGTMLRSKNDDFWIGFPLFITGNASWMEAISAMALWRHDNIDAGDSKIRDIRMLLLRHSGRTMLDTLPEFPQAFLSTGDNDFYGDLEEWTAWAMAFSGTMHAGYNRLADIMGVGVSRALAREEVKGKGKADRAMLAPAVSAIRGFSFKEGKARDLGGIAMNSDQAMVVRAAGRTEMQWRVDPEQLQHLKDIAGLTPVQVDIYPLANVPDFLGAGHANVK